LHMLFTFDGTYHSMELTKASVRDSQYLKEIKHSGLRDCLLLADKGYLSAQGQLEILASKGIDLKTPMRRYHRDWRPYPKILKTARRRIETRFSQLCDQMMLKRNYAKSFIGLRARLIAKVTAVSLLQYINEQNDRPINNIKHALAA